MSFGAPRKQPVARGVITSRVLALLEHRGPLSLAQVDDALPEYGLSARRAVLWLRSRGQAHVVDYVWTHSTGRTYPRAVYAAGPGKDKPKPKRMTGAEKARRYRARKGVPACAPRPAPHAPPPRIAYGTAPSIFDLAQQMKGKHR